MPMPQEKLDLGIEEIIPLENRFGKWLYHNRWPAFLGLLGLLFLSIGVLTSLIASRKQAKVEILPAEGVEEAQSTSGTMIVDVQGAVISPGIYELEYGSRLNDLLIRAGGLSVEADRDYTAKNFNLASKLTDGAKIYIHSTGEVKGVVEYDDIYLSDKININTASEAELDRLYGVGEKTAAKIIDGRPYSNVDELLDKKAVTKSTFEEIKDKITVY